MMDLLTALDHVVRPAADAVHDRISRALVMLDSGDRSDRERRQALEDERKGLLAARDPDPPLPHWTRQVSGDGVPLWRAVDFAAELGEGQRAGLEGALLASGLLATITDSGLAAPDGRLLLRATGPLAANPLSDALVVETTSALPAELVRDVLDRVALGDQGHPTWVDTEGAWGNGPLTGRHRTSARHIGAAARAAARAARLTEIDVSLAALAGAAENRALQRQALHDERDALASHLRTAPQTSEPVRSAHTLTVAARQRVKRVEPMCHKARKAATDLRRESTAALAAHRAACAEFDLPTVTDELSAVRDRLRDAVRLCKTAGQRLAELRQRVDVHANAVAGAQASRRPRHDAEVTAAEKWGTWHGEAAELAAIRETMGATAEQARADLISAEKGLAACRRETGIPPASAPPSLPGRRARLKPRRRWLGRTPPTGACPAHRGGGEASLPPGASRSGGGRDQATSFPRPVDAHRSPQRRGGRRGRDGRTGQAPGGRRRRADPCPADGRA